MKKEFVKIVKMLCDWEKSYRNGLRDNGKEKRACWNGFRGHGKENLKKGPKWRLRDTKYTEEVQARLRNEGEIKKCKGKVKVKGYKKNVERKFKQ